MPGVGVFMLKTLSKISWQEAAENETVYAIGEQKPVGNKQNAYKFTGKFSIQEGEIFNIIQSCGVQSAIQIPNATLSITSLLGGPSYNFKNLCINNSSIDFGAKDKESVRNMDWTALDVTN